MKPIPFRHQNTVLAKDQPEYQELPAFMNEEEAITLWRLSWTERILILFTGHLWLRQLNFSRPLQPQMPTIQSPFMETPDMEYHEAHRRETNRFRLTSFFWLSLSIIGPWFSTEIAFLVMYYLVLILVGLAILLHWSSEAIAHRAYIASDPKKEPETP
jgi:hypothetical protein